MAFKNQRTAYFSLCALTNHANGLQYLGGYCTKVHQVFSGSHFFIDDANATILIVIRPLVVK